MKTNRDPNPSMQAVTGLGMIPALMICILALFITTGCETGVPAAPIPVSASSPRPSGALAPGDEISVSFSGAPELNSRMKIQPNGRVSLPTIGDVNAAGKTITSFQTQLRALYQPHLQDPTVVVGLQSAAASVYVTGEVHNPGKVPLDRPMTALEAVMEVGGFTSMANPRQVIVVRNEQGRTQRYILNMNNTLKGVDNTPFYLRPFDVLYVKQSVW
jgi:polysaccharide export outer membrane protein